MPAAPELQGSAACSVGGWEAETPVRSWQACSAHGECVPLSASLFSTVVVVTWPHLRGVFPAAGRAALTVHPPLYKAAFSEPGLYFLSHAEPTFTDFEWSCFLQPETGSPQNTSRFLFPFVDKGLAGSCPTETPSARIFGQYFYHTLSQSEI